MPYITPELRDRLDPEIEMLIGQIVNVAPKGKIDGVLNYVVSRIVAASAKEVAARDGESWGYHTISEAVKVLTDAAAEMRRRLLDIYETSAIIKNGDLPEYAGDESVDIIKRLQERAAEHIEDEESAEARLRIYDGRFDDEGYFVTDDHNTRDNDE